MEQRSDDDDGENELGPCTTCTSAGPGCFKGRGGVRVLGLQVLGSRVSALVSRSLGFLGQFA